jgi:hypothetical protein
MSSRNRYLEAFKESFNVIGLTTAAAASMALIATPFMPIPLLIAGVAEVAYLLFYADSRWYAVRMAKKFDADVEARRAQLKQQVLPLLRPVMQARFLRLEEVRRNIGERARDEAEWFLEVLRKLDFLLEKFLHFAHKDVQFRDYLETVRGETQQPNTQNVPGANRAAATSKTGVVPALRTTSQVDPRGRGLAGALPPTTSGIASNRLPGQVPPAPTSKVPRDASEMWTRRAVEDVQAAYDSELSGLRQVFEAETEPETRAVLEKRLDVLQRRRDFVGKIGRIQTNLNHQLNLVEDTFGLISDELYARTPEQVISDIDEVVSQTNTMTQLLEEVAPFERLLT